MKVGGGFPVNIVCVVCLNVPIESVPRIIAVCVWCWLRLSQGLRAIIDRKFE